MNTTHKLLTLLIVAVLLLTLTVVAQINQASQPATFQPVGEGDRVMYAVDNPYLQQELHARIMAPGIKQETVGAR